jgi:hypothetical protein
MCVCVCVCVCVCACARVVRVSAATPTIHVLAMDPWGNFRDMRFNACTMHFFTMTNKRTVISQMITLLIHVLMLSCYPQEVCSLYLAKLHSYIECISW